MNLTAQELSFVRTQGLYITEKCDGCGKLLNHSVRYTITGKAGVYCSAPCRDLSFFGDRHEAKKQATPGRCANCGGPLQGKKRGSIYCDDICRKRHSRKEPGISTAEVQKSRTPGQLFQ